MLRRRVALLIFSSPPACSSRYATRARPSLRVHLFQRLVHDGLEDVPNVPRLLLGLAGDPVVLDVGFKQIIVAALDGWRWARLRCIVGFEARSHRVVPV